MENRVDGNCIFVTGTDTGVGKTVVSSLLLSALRKKGRSVSYFKPIQSGTEDVDQVVQWLGLNTSEVVPPVYTFSEPISPHRAAAKTGVSIDLELVAESWNSWRQQGAASFSVVEGAGGLLCPLTPKQGIRELIVALNTPTILVSSTRLGTLNHTLLSLECAKAKGVLVRGVVLIGKADPGLAEAMEQCMPETQVLAEIPFVEDLDAHKISGLGGEHFPEPILKKIFHGYEV